MECSSLERLRVSSACFSYCLSLVVEVERRHFWTVEVDTHQFFKRNNRKEGNKERREGKNVWPLENMMASTVPNVIAVLFYESIICF